MITTTQAMKRLEIIIKELDKELTTKQMDLVVEAIGLEYQLTRE